MKKLLIAAVAAALLAGCTAKAEEEYVLPNALAIGTMGGSALYMFQDNEQGNICYAIDYGGRPALSCVPREQLR